MNNSNDAYNSRTNVVIVVAAAAAAKTVTIAKIVVAMFACDRERKQIKEK